MPASLTWTTVQQAAQRFGLSGICAVASVSTQMFMYLADCEVDGSVRPVGDTNEKVRAIHRHHRSASPATLIMPTGIRDSERASMGTDNEWSETRWVSTLDELIAARSCSVETAIASLEHLADHLDKTPWLKNGQPVRLSEIHVRPSVLKEELYGTGVIDSPSPRAGDLTNDLHTFKYEFAPGSMEIATPLQVQTCQVRVPWHEEFKRGKKGTPPFPAYLSGSVEMIIGFRESS
jgi:hypothetical protein